MEEVLSVENVKKEYVKRGSKFKALGEINFKVYICPFL